MSKIRVRFAPSPTGYLHIGSLRTALYDYLFAQKNDGDFILKIEDTDRKRFVDGAVESLIGSLDSLGLKRNEGVFQKTINKNNDRPVLNSKNYPGILEVGDYGPYIQSEKIEIYKKSDFISDFFFSELLQENKNVNDINIDNVFIF